MENDQFGSKNKMAKNMRKTTLESHNNCSMQKTDLKNSSYSRNKRILKMRKKWPLGKGYSLCKMDSLDQKNKVAKNMRKTTLESHNICSIQKTDLKSS